MPPVVWSRRRPTLPPRLPPSMAFFEPGLAQIVAPPAAAAAEAAAAAAPGAALPAATGGAGFGVAAGGGRGALSDFAAVNALLCCWLKSSPAGAKGLLPYTPAIVQHSQGVDRK